MSQSLYDSDVVAWSEHQGDLLRRHSTGERLNEAVDWPNIIEEIEDLGRSELHSCESLLRQAIVHLLKLHVWPESQDTPHWRIEVVGFLIDARRRYTPSMRGRIDLAGLYDAAVRQIQAGATEALALPAICPFGLDHLLAQTADLASLIKLLG